MNPLATGLTVPEKVSFSFMLAIMRLYETLKHLVPENLSSTCKSCCNKYVFKKDLMPQHIRLDMHQAFIFGFLDSYSTDEIFLQVDTEVILKTKDLKFIILSVNKFLC